MAVVVIASNPGQVGMFVLVRGGDCPICRLLQFMTLLSGLTFPRKVSFLPAVVTLEIGLIEGFLLRLVYRSGFSLLVPFRSRLTISYVQLYLL